MCALAVQASHGQTEDGRAGKKNKCKEASRPNHEDEADKIEGQANNRRVEQEVPGRMVDRC